MTEAKAQELKIELAGDPPRHLSGLLLTPARAQWCYVLAHGAGAGMTHPFLTAIAEGLAVRHVATLRYQFPFMESGKGRPDRPEVAQATVRAAVAAARSRLPGLRLIAGGKSFGGRMTSQAQAAEALEGVEALAFLGFPLHLAKEPSVLRAAHLFDVRIPMLFLQGATDALADLGELRPLVAKLGPLATLKTIDDADHSFHVPVRSGRTDAAVRDELLDYFVRWSANLVKRRRHPL